MMIPYAKWFSSVAQYTLLLSGVLAASAASGAEQGAKNLEFEVRLFTTPDVARQKQEGLVLITDLTMRDGRWERAWSILDVNNRKPGTTEMRVAAAEPGADPMKLTLELRNGDRYELTLRATPTGRYEGSYTGTRHGQPAQGGADARIKPARPALAADFIPLKPGEHPRILFRKHELASLREKFRTPLGQALGAQWSGLVGLGLKYQMTGDARIAEQCAQAVRTEMADRGGGFPGDRAWANRIEFVATAYDLCYDAWPAELKREVEKYLLAEAGHWAGGGGSNAHVSSNRAAPQYGGAAIAGLALWGEPGPAPAEPADELGKHFWRDEVEKCKQLGGADPRFLLVFERARQLMVLHYREGVGAGGFHGECAHYATEATDNPARYATAYRRCFGYDVSPDPDINNWLQCRMFAHIYPSDKAPWPLGINGWQTVPEGYWASLYPIVPEQVRPAVLWAWQRHEGFAGADDLLQQMQAKKGKDGKPNRGLGFTADPRFFVNYPFDGKPQPPAGIMPLTWRADGLGYYGFRNSWEGKSDCIVQVFAKTHPVLAWSGANAGSFRLVALNTPWTGNPLKREIDRWDESCVMLPEDQADMGGCGLVTHADFGRDGSGTLTMDLSDIYTPKSQYTKYGNCRVASVCAGQTGASLRALGVDYSGKCGAPCLVVLVDKIGFSKKKVWTWMVPDASLLKAVAIKGNTWSLDSGGANLCATFVTPAQTKLSAGIHVVDTKDFKSRPLHKEYPLVMAEGGDDFFVIVTVQPKGTEPPAVKVNGTGLDGKVTVGGRSVTFDGTKIVIAGGK